MLRNLKRTLRDLKRNPNTSLINLLGLSIGLLTSMLIAIYIYNEWRTDDFIPEQNKTFRVLRTSSINGEAYDIGITSAPFANALKVDFPNQVQETVRVLDGGSIIQIGSKSFREEDYYYADANFLRFFNIPLLHGDSATALSHIHQLVITEELAIKYFGDPVVAMGKNLRIDDSYEAVITGVMDKLPYKSHFQFGIIESMHELEQASWFSNWWNNNLCTYIRLDRADSAPGIQAQLPAFMDKYFADDFERNGSRIDLRLQPVNKVYFEPETRYDPMRHGDKGAIMIFLCAALFLLFIASANYINLSTAKSVERLKEIALYKILGSGRKEIIFQNLFESFLLISIAMAMALFVLKLSVPTFENLFGISLLINYPALKLVVILLGFTLILALASGFYPAIFLANFKPINYLKGYSLTGNSSTAKLRKSLVVGQFVISAALISSTIIIYQQLDMLKSKDLGFQDDFVLTMQINNPDMYYQKERFKTQLLAEPGTKSISFTSGIPGGHHDATNVKIPELDQSLRMRTTFADFEFVETLGLEIVAGRNFDSRLTSDSSEVALLNEKAVAGLGLTNEEILGKKIQLASFDTINRRVVGIVKDYHFSSLRDVIEPLVITPSFGAATIVVKADPGRITEVIKTAEEAWTSIAPAFPFSYQFLDGRLGRLYQTEIQQGKLFLFFASIAILIACLGMFGLATYATIKRSKEISIRKVLGASVARLVSLLTWDFLRLVFLAFLISIPISVVFMQKWLQNFAYRIDLKIWHFAIAAIIAITVAFVTIGVHSIKAALTNPANTLKSE